MTYYIVYDVFVTELGLRGSELNVYSAIYSAVAHLNGYISIVQICRQTGVSETRVCEILKSLEKRALITRSSVGYRRKNKYELKGVAVGNKSFPLLLSTNQEKSTTKIGDFIKFADQNYYDIGGSTPTKKLLPIVNKL